MYARERTETTEQKYRDERIHSNRFNSRSREAEQPVQMLHQAAGNQAVQTLSKSGTLGGNRISTGSGDAPEQEAKRVASEVVGHSNPSELTAGSWARPSTERTTRVEETTGGNGAMELIPIAPETERAVRVGSGGRQLPADVRTDFEPQFGADFGDVTIHTGPDSADLNNKLNSEAFTYGSDIYFSEGSYRPETVPGRKLLAHELTHVLQQTGDRTSQLVQRQELGPEKQNQQSESLSTEEREWLIDRIGFRMSLAYTKYVDAAAEHQRKLRDIAAQQAEMAGLVLDVIFAFAAPGLGRLVSRGIAGAVPTDAPLSVYRVANGAMDRADQIVSASTSVGKHIAKSGFESAIQRDESEQFVQTLKQNFSVAIDQIHGSLQNKSDEELSILYFNYDPSIATFKYYEQQIGQLVSRYQAQVEPIGKGEFIYGSHAILDTENRAFWIRLPKGTYLGLVEAVEQSYPFEYEPEFIGWVGDSMADLAIKKTRQVTGKDPQTISWEEVEGLSLGSISFLEHVLHGKAPTTGQ